MVMVKNDKSTSAEYVLPIETPVTPFPVLVMAEIETLSAGQQANEYM